MLYSVDFFYMSFGLFGPFVRIIMRMRALYITRMIRKSAQNYYFFVTYANILQ